MKKALMVGVGLASLTIGCKKSPPAKPVSFAIFEVVDCAAGRSAPMPLHSSDEKYCIAANPIVSEKDIAGAAPGHNEQGEPVLNMYFHSSRRRPHA